MLKNIVLALLAAVALLGSAGPASAQLPIESHAPGRRDIVVAASKEYDEQRRVLERQREVRKDQAYQRGREAEKTTGFLLGCLLGGVGIIISYVMD